MAEQRPTYQHFIPQFLLRNFAHPYCGPNANPKVSKRSRKRGSQKGKPFPGDPAVYHVNLVVNPPTLEESSVKRVMGQIDMYRDTTQSSNRQQHVENMFAKLESSASTAFRRLTKAFEEGHREVCLQRDERNLIRKFLFLLKYRGSGFHRRFYHVDIQEYSEDDSSLLRNYMEEKGFKRPFDVWLSNLKAIMELKMDAENKWCEEIVRLMYPDDAVWFIAHVQLMYMALCTPSAESTQEFIVTDNCYGVFEGPVTLARDLRTGIVQETIYANLHEFAPISPKLVIVLRSSIFPSPEEDADPVVKRGRDELRAEVIDNQFSTQAWAESALVDLPIHKAHNSYSTVVNGRIHLRHGQNGKFKQQDKFFFPFFSIDKVHVDAINGIFLDNTWRSTTIVFASQSTFFETLETYLTSTTHRGKVVTDEDGDLRIPMLQKLEILLKAMGSSKQPVWNVISVDEAIDYENWIRYHTEIRQWVWRIAKTPLQDQSPFFLTYLKMGGSPYRFLDDVTQSRLMWILRVKIDAWSVGLDERLRYRNRCLLNAAYLRCPSRRVWFYAKWVKIAHRLLPNISEGDELSECNIDQLWSGDEDIIAKARGVLGENERSFNELILRTAINGFELEEWQDLDLWGPVALPLQQFRRRIVFATPGSIYCAGLPGIDTLAILAARKLFAFELFNIGSLENLAFEIEEIFELQSRALLRGVLSQILEPKMEKGDLNDLLRVLFEVTYPTPPGFGT